MLKGILSKVVGDPNERQIEKLQPMVDAINGLEPEMEQRTEAELRALTGRFRARLASGDTLDSILAEAYAAVREVAKRTVDMRPFDVQLIGGIVLHQGKVAEMRTGEGKTLVATMPVYLNALLGRGVHLVTVNDYLARRDSLWMGPIYHLMGLSVGLLQSGAEQPAYIYDPGHQREPYPGLRPVPRREAYAADITYGTNNEFGFDYLRDNLALTLERRVQRPLYYAIVDEVDNIFIDEARTPLIISGPSGEPVEEYSRFAAIARRLEPEVHYELDEKQRSVYLTDEGLAVVEQETGIENIYDEANYRYVHYMQQALKAHVLYLEGRDYIRQRKQIILIDQHTGRLMPNRRLSEGLHQAIEAKEGVPIRPRDVTSATVTIQNYFRMYEKLAGMSGTAVTEGEEFFKIYKLDVLAIPTNKPVIRADHADVVYRGEEAKLRAVTREILDCHSQGQPVLVGTTSVEMSERLSKRLTGERLQMAAMAPRIAYALQDAELDREERSRLRETLNDSLETMNSAAWRRMVRTLDLDPNALSDDNVDWIADYLELPDDAAVRRKLERALREDIPHSVLNAKEHTREAAIIARAGEPGSVTIATNMAGRGVDIKLGGEISDEVIHRAHQAMRARGLDPFNATSAQMDSAIAEVLPQYAKRREQVLAAGGLHVLGTERHEARRIDNQLRGRSGRQGEPGSSRFYLSLEDDLMRRFGRKEMLSKLMEQIGDDFPIEHNLVSRTLERAQTSVEGYNFDIRKHLLEYDDVLNRQRETIYDERLHILRSDDLRDEVWRMLESQVDEYLERYSGEEEQQRLLFAGLDDVVPLILPAPDAPFQGPLEFGGHLTAFPPYTISFLADQLADRHLETVQRLLSELPQDAAAGYGEQVRNTVRELAQATLEKYDERLDRYRALLDEKLEDYLQLLQERGQPLDPRRLVQNLERTYPLKLTMPPGRDLADMEGLDDLRDFWMEEVEVEFHRQTCAGLIDRAQIRLPLGVRLDRVRPAQVPQAKLVDEMRRVVQLAVKQAKDERARDRMTSTLPAGDASPAQVLAFIAAIKDGSDLDFGRLDRLVGHVLGAYLYELLSQYAKATDEDQVQVRRDLERLQDAVTEGKKGGRTNLQGLLGQLNDLVHLEIPTVEELLGLAVGHEYDKWAQRQVSEIEAETVHSPLTHTGWEPVAQHLLATHYTQRQVYDRGHRRRATWMPRLPFSYIAQAYVEQMEPQDLRNEVLASLRWAAEQRERIWGAHELQRWGHLSLEDLSPGAYDDLVRYLGEQELGELQARPIEDLPPHIYEHLRFTLAVQKLEKRHVRLGEVPQADALMERLKQALEEEVLHTPVGELDEQWQERLRNRLRETGLLDDPELRAQLEEQPLRNWDRRTRDQVASFLGRQFVDSHKDQPIAELDPQARGTVVAYLQSRRRFVDEEQVQNFLVHQRLSDLTRGTAETALLYLARTTLERLSRRKISNLDVKTRQVVTDSLQRMGMFTDEARRTTLLTGTLSDLKPRAREGFGSYLAREQIGQRSMSELDGDVRHNIVERLRQRDLLTDVEKIEGIDAQRLNDLDADIATQIRDELVAHLHADLASKTMEELSATTRQQIHEALGEQNYFVDHEKVGWYERKTIAQLPGDLLRGLELYEGHRRLEGMADTQFRDLPAETRETLEALFDSEGLLSDRAERLRLTQTGAVGQLPEDVLEMVAQHLGRQWLVQIRNKRPPDLEEKDRATLWSYLRAQGYFADEFKEELFAYQRLDEFDTETQQAVEASLSKRLLAELDSQPIGQLSADVQAQVRAGLRQSDYFVDRTRLRQLEMSPVPELPLELRQGVEAALGAHLLADVESRPVADLPAAIQATLWRYLDEIGYFLDENRRSQMMDRRLADLGSDSYETIVADLASQLEEEVLDTPVSELDETLRQGLREAVEVQGHFESEAVKAEATNQPLGSLRREDLTALASEFGNARLDTWGDRRLGELPEMEREDILAHLQASDWFLDHDRLNELRSQRLADLEGDLRRDLVSALCQQQAAHLRQQPLEKLAGEQRNAVLRILEQQGLGLDTGEMRPFRRQQLRELDREIYHQLLRDLGARAVTGWNTTRFQELDDEQQALLSAYLGRRIMGRIERRVLLHTISRLWIDYLTDIEDLRRGIGLEAFGQRDPLVEYKRRAFELFEELGDNIRRTTVRSLFRQAPEPLDIE